VVGDGCCRQQLREDEKMILLETSEIVDDGIDGIGCPRTTDKKMADVGGHVQKRGRGHNE
jgi:hypothetical protein